MIKILPSFKKKIIFPLILSAAIAPACNAPESKSTDTVSDSSTTNVAMTNNEDWEVFYPGKNIKGWHTHGGDSVGSAWKAEDSILHLDASRKKEWQSSGGGDLVTDAEYENFDLKLEWKISEAGNSGIIFYVHEDTTKYKNTWESGPEMQICDNAKNEDGKLMKHKAGDLYDLMSSTSEKFVKPAGEWNEVEIKSDHGTLDFYMNNEHVLSTTLWDDSWQKLIAGSKFKTMDGFGTYKKGRIALQDHGADVWFRNIKIKKL